MIRIILFMLVSITGKKYTKMSKDDLSSIDPSSFSRPDLAVVTNVFINLDVSFEKKVLTGHVDLTVKKIDESVNELVLDAKGLNIKEIIETETKNKLKYTLSEQLGEIGSKLSIELPPKDTNNYIINIQYETSPDASGLQWLEPVHTAGKQHPFVFSQFQAIHARSVIPCQDTPAVKAKYSAVISAPTGLTVLMSAICERSKPLEDKTEYYFKQDIPVQSYLIAIAVGALEYRTIGPRSKVWAEKEMIEASEYEFMQTEHQLKTAEDICGPYVWGIYDLLVLPPSFPFGGMENPCLTFVTPTLLAGDRSLVDVVAHEIAHSWTGNLVTNRNFEHFWLNEGFTVFVERKIVGRLVNKAFQDFQAYGGSVELSETVDRLGHDNPLTKLVVDLKDVHPDDAFSVIPYEKGHTFLRYLENIVGGPNQFEPFLRKYFDNFKYKSITTDDFKSYFINYFSKVSNIKEIDWETWLYGSGMPPIIPQYDMTYLKTCEDWKQRFLQWNGSTPIPFTNKDLESFTSNHKIQFLQLLLDEAPQPIEKLKQLEELLKLGDAKNSEIKFRWLRIGLKAHWEEKIHPTLEWVIEVGRMKFVRPLYRDLYKWEVSRPQAIEIYESNKQNMMHVSAYTVAKDLNLVK